MYCTKCGTPLREGAAFCPRCGAAVETAARKVCPACGSSAEEDMVFCDRCGSRLVLQSGGAANYTSGGGTQQDRTPGSTQQDRSAPQPEASGGSSRELLTQKMASWYKGETKVGIARATGTLTVFTDRLELKKQMGSALAGVSPIALAYSASKAKKENVEVFWMRDIAEAKEGRYGAVMPSLILRMRSGEAHTFAGTFTSGKVQEILGLIRRYSAQ